MESNNDTGIEKIAKKKFLAPLLWKMGLVFFVLSILNTLVALFKGSVQLSPYYLVWIAAIGFCYYMLKTPKTRAKELYNSAILSLNHDDSERAQLLLDEAVLLYDASDRINLLSVAVKKSIAWDNED